MKGISSKTWFLPLMAILVVGSVLASGIIISNTVNLNSHVRSPSIVLGEISSFNGTNYPGGDYDDLVGIDPIVGNLYDFSCQMAINANVEGVYLNITINKSGGEPLAANDIALSVCDYFESNDPADWAWKPVYMVIEGDHLLGVCDPSWGNDLLMKDECNLINAFRIIYNDTADFSISITATTAPPTISLNLLQIIQQRGTLIVGTQVPYPPFETYNSTSGRLEGIDIEIMEYVAAKLNVTIQWETMDFDQLFTSVQTGQVDCAISCITITPARDQYLDFSTPYFIDNQAVLVRDESTISTWDDLNDSSIVTQIGTTGQWWVDDTLSPESNTPLSDVSTAVLGVNNGQYDAFIVSTTVADIYANDTSFDLKIAFVINTLVSYGVMIPEDEPELKAALDGAISDMIADGILDEIIVRWMA